jgi:hypothetical protein
MQSDDKPFFKISKENFNFDYYYGFNTAKIRNSYTLEDKLKNEKMGNPLHQILFSLTEKCS